MIENKIVLYGAGKVMNQTKKVLESVNVIPEAIFDKNPQLWGNKVTCCNLQVEIKSPKEIKEYDKNNITIVITVGRGLYNEVNSELSRCIKNAKLVYHQIVIYEIAKKYYKFRKTNWLIDYESAVEQWLSLLPDEMYHHKLAMSEYKNVDSSNWNRSKEIPRLSNYRVKENMFLLDIGSGSLLKYDSVINGKKIKYIPVDVLKDGYDYLRNTYNFKVPYATHFAFGEHLRCFFQGGG